ncbi:hypothetical protein LQZ44_12200 [Alcaligenes nematophilus]|uniref:hypothetical protein n=1 Tax=Alcaligenes nematophilus TaxID=2994643 RepID=UPI0035B53F5B
MSKRKIEQERAEFELWMRKHRPYESLHRKFKNDPYNPGVQCYWEAWQARAAIDAARKEQA